MNFKLKLIDVLDIIESGEVKEGTSKFNFIKKKYPIAKFDNK